MAMPDIINLAVLEQLTYPQMREYCRLYHMQVNEQALPDTAQGRIALRCHIGAHIGRDQLYFASFVG
jgi:hypothetical protein